MARAKSTPLLMREANGRNGSDSNTSGTGTDAAANGPDDVGYGSGNVASGNGDDESGDAIRGSESGNGTTDSGHRIDSGSKRGYDSDGSQTSSGSSGGDSDFYISGDDANGRGSNRTGSGRAETTDGFTDTVTSNSGRHKRKQCGCEKCTAWRQLAGVAREVSDDTGPATVSFESLSGRTRKMAKNLTAETIGIGVSALFELPTLVLPPGTAQHWPLNKAEEKSLVERIEAVADMLPKKVKTKGVEFAAKVLPPLALVVTAILITKPRIDMTRMYLAMRAPQRPTGPTPTDQSNDSVQPIDGRVVGEINPDTTRANGSAHNTTDSVRRPNEFTPSGDGVVSDSASGNGHTGRDALNNIAFSPGTF